MEAIADKVGDGEIVEAEKVYDGCPNMTTCPTKLIWDGLLAEWQTENCDSFPRRLAYMSSIMRQQGDEWGRCAKLTNPAIETALLPLIGGDLTSPPHQEQECKNAMSRKRRRSESPGRDVLPVVFISSPIEDRGSTHIGLYSPSITAKQLQARPDVKEASHRIAAWRTPGKQRSLSGEIVCETGHDDDGEQYAGKKLEKVLADLNVEGAVVVARWYGGILLGPVRFQHFENCAREAISKWKQMIGDGAKRRKMEEEEQIEKGKLAKVLEQRDASITVLRDLLAEKKSTATTDGKNSPQPSQSQGSSTKNDYSTIDLPALKRLEKARDGTLTWILKQIDKAEEAHQIMETASESKVSGKEAQKRSEEFGAAEDE